MSRNVVLVCLDSVRKDYFDRYAPRLGALADVSFEQCRAASSWSVPSHATMITGELPHRHGVHTHNRNFSTLSRERTLFDELPSEYHAAGISANVYAGPAYGFDTFFDTFVDAPRYQYFVDGLNAVGYFQESTEDGISLYLSFLRRAIRHDHSFKSLANGVAAQVKWSSFGAPFRDPMDDGANLIRREALRLFETVDDPMFLFLNFMEAHAPYSPIRGMDRSLYSAPNSWTSATMDYWDVVSNPERYADDLELLRELYAANVEYLDRVVARLLEDLQRATDRETTVLVTADHGENLGYPHEDGLLEHKSSLSESLLHVPLTVVNPPGDPEPTEERPVSHCGLPELVLGFANDRFPDVTTDRTVAEHVGLSPGPDPPDDYRYWDRMQRCASDGTRKVVWDSLGNATAYRVDPSRPCWEAELDENATVPDWAIAAFDGDIAEYKRRAAAQTHTRDVDALTERRLAELGYI